MAEEGRDPMRPKRLICQQFIRITLACWKFLRNNVNEWLIALAKCPSVHDCCLHLAEGNLHARGLQQLQICERIQNGGFISGSCLGSWEPLGSRVHLNDWLLPVQCTASMQSGPLFNSAKALSTYSLFQGKCQISVITEQSAAIS